MLKLAHLVPQRLSPEQLAELTPARKRVHGGAAAAAAMKQACAYTKTVKIAKKSEYCQVCYAHWRGVPEEQWPVTGGTGPQKLKRQCNSSSKGCVGCGMRICAECWGPGGSLFTHQTKATARDFASTPKKSQTHKRKPGQF